MSKIDINLDEQSTSPALNEKQQEVYDKFVNFLLNDQKVFFLSGGAGTGKTFLIKYLSGRALNEAVKLTSILGSDLKVKDVLFSATTNRATLNLGISDADTIYGLISAKPARNYSENAPLKYEVLGGLTHSVIFVDECSMLNGEFLQELYKNCENCKFVFVGDTYQLPTVSGTPIKWPLTEESTDEMEACILTDSVRTRNHVELTQLIEALRNQVINISNNPSTKFMDINLIPGVIEHYDDSQMHNKIVNWYSDNKKKMIVCYTNKKCEDYIRYFNKVHNKSYIEIGGVYTARHFTRSLKTPNASAVALFSDEKIRVLSYSLVHKAVRGRDPLSYYDTRVESLDRNFVSHYAIPQNWEDTEKWCKDIKTNHDIDVRDRFLFLGQSYVGTIHKAQGVTLDEVYIDLDSFSACRDAEQAARLLYVACSRAKDKIVFYGKLPTKFGKLIGS